MSCVKLLLAIFDENVIDKFVESCKCDKLTSFTLRVSEHTQVLNWDRIIVEIDFISSLSDISFLHARDVAKVASIFPTIYIATTVEKAIELSLKLLATFTIIR